MQDPPIVLIGSEEILGGTKIPEEVLKYQNFKFFEAQPNFIISNYDTSVFMKIFLKENLVSMNFILFFFNCVLNAYAILTLYSIKTPLKAFENIMENGAFALLEQMLHFPKYKFFRCCLKIENNVMILK